MHYLETRGEKNEGISETYFMACLGNLSTIAQNEEQGVSKLISENDEV